MPIEIVKKELRELVKIVQWLDEKLTEEETYLHGYAVKRPLDKAAADISTAAHWCYQAKQGLIEAIERAKEPGLGKGPGP
jgi:hypothetical protein